MRSRIVLVVLAIVCVVHPGIPDTARLSAQSLEKAALSRALDDLTNTIALLRPQLDDQSPAFTALRSLVWLKEQTNTWRPSSFDDGRAFRESIERMTRALRTARDPALKAALLQPIAADLQDKEEFCRREGLTTRRRVDVVTKRNGITEVKGFEVLYLEKFLENDPTAAPQQFRGFSSPAVDELVPGRYVFWAKEPGKNGRSGARKEGRVSIDSPQGPIEVLTP